MNALTEAQIRELELWIGWDGKVSPQIRDQIRQLIGEVRQFRDREAQTRFLMNIEGEG